MDWYIIENGLVRENKLNLFRRPATTWIALWTGETTEQNCERGEEGDRSDQRVPQKKMHQPFNCQRWRKNTALRAPGAEQKIVQVVVPLCGIFDAKLLPERRRRIAPVLSPLNIWVRSSRGKKVFALSLPRRRTGRDDGSVFVCIYKMLVSFPLSRFSQVFHSFFFLLFWLHIRDRRVSGFSLT